MMCSIVNERIKSAYRGYTTMRMGLDGILYGSMFFEQGKYSYVNILDKFSDNLSIDDVTYKKLKCTDQSTTPLVRELVQSVITSLLKLMRAQKCTPQELLQGMLDRIKMFLKEYDFSNMGNFISIKKYKEGVKHTHLIDVVTRHNQTVAALLLDVPYIYPGQQVSIIHVKKKNKWRFNGAAHTSTSNNLTITFSTYNPDIHEIDMEYYLRSSKADLISIIRSFGFTDDGVTKTISKTLNDIFDRAKEPSGTKKALFLKWWPAFDGLFKHDEFLGLSKFVCSDYRKLREYIFSYLHNIEEKIISDAPLGVTCKDWELSIGIKTTDLNSQYNKALALLTDMILGDLGIICVKIFHAFLSNIDEMFKLHQHR